MFVPLAFANGPIVFDIVTKDTLPSSSTVLIIIIREVKIINLTDCSFSCVQEVLI
jgi:hypothetical protein